MFGDVIDKVKNCISKTAEKFGFGIANVFKNKRKLDDDAIQELKDVLISADVDYCTASVLMEELSCNKFDKEVTCEDVKLFLADSISDKLRLFEEKIDVNNTGRSPQVIMFCGVNGNGKTTTIAKLAYRFKSLGKRVIVAPCDTFRAAAEEQLALWIERVGCDILTDNNTKDAASIAYKAIVKAKEVGYDALFIDTAGRLHTNADLMNELKKISSVMKKCDPSLSCKNLLVLDATVGQNAFNQIQFFKEYISIDGLIVTKLDGTAKAGVLVGIANRFKDLKLCAIGVGESLDDLHDFSAKRFAYNLLDLDYEEKKQ